MKKHIQKTFSGFTLVELMIATSLFVMVLSFGLSLYVSINRIQRNNFLVQKVYSESRFWLDWLVAEVESGKLIYNPSVPYPSGQPEDEVYLIDRKGRSLRYFWDSSDFSLKRQIGLGLAERLTSPEVRITKLYFYILPQSESSTSVPRMAIIWKAQDLRPEKISNSISLQTFVTARSY